MTDGPRGGTGNFLRGTVAPGRERPGVGIVWLDRLSLVATDGSHPSFGPRAAVIRSVPAVVEGEAKGPVADRGRAATVGAMVEVPAGYLVVDVRVGYATAAGGFVGELRIVDLGGHRKSALLLLERRQAGDESAERLFVDAPTAPTGKRTYLSIRASVDRANHVAVRGLRLCLTQA
jgi:hypothetical protein